MGEDGGYVVVGREEPVKLPCLACGRRRSLQWRAAVGLPIPFPRTLPAHGRGCTRDHAAGVLATRWEDAAGVFRQIAQHLREDPEPSLWHEQLADLRARQADRAQWLSTEPRRVRQLALRLWTANEQLNVSDTDTLVAGILAQ